MNRSATWVWVTVWLALFGLAHGQMEDMGPDVLFQNGLRAFSNASYEESASYFQQLISRFGSEPSLAEQMEGVYYAMGCALYNIGRYKEAIDTFAEYVKRHPKAKYKDEALFRIAAAHQSQDDVDSATTAYRRVIEEVPDSPFAEDAGFQLAVCYVIKQDHDAVVKTVDAFQKAYPRSDLFAQATVFKARALFEQEKYTEALDSFDAFKGRTKDWDHVVYMNFLAVEIGDAAFENTDYDLALRAYRWVRTRGALLRLQRRLIAVIEAELEFMSKLKPDASKITERFRKERRLRSSLAQAKDLLTKIEQMPDYDAGLFHRIGRCYFNTDQFWEARVAFKRVVDEAKEETLREAGHFDLVLVMSRMRAFDDVIEEATRYLKTYE